ncbi:hypothetical protein AHAS_Ahas02G0121700 [Arachis hypogaea]
MEFTSSFNQSNFIGYCPPSQYDSSHYSNDSWEYHQEDTDSGHSNSWSYASEPQDEKESHMGYFPPPQNDASHDSNGGWEGNSSAPCDIHPKTSSLDQTSTESPFQNSPPTQTSMNHSRFSKLESMFKKYEEETKKLWKRKENFFTNMKVHVAQVVSATKKEEKQEEEATASSEIAKKEEVVETFEPKTALEMTREPEHSQPPQTPLDQRCSTLIEKYEEEMKKAWENQQTSSMKELLKQMLSVKEEVEERESE